MLVSSCSACNHIGPVSGLVDTILDILLEEKYSDEALIVRCLVNRHIPGIPGTLLNASLVLTLNVASVHKGVHLLTACTGVNVDFTSLVATLCPCQIIPPSLNYSSL